MAEEDKKKNIILISIMIIALVGTLFLVLKKDEQYIAPSTSLEDALVDFDGGPTISNRVESDIFSSEDFKSLQEYSDQAFELEPRGKKNPFEPFRALPEPR